MICHSQLVVNRAPDPSTILWEHLGASRCERFSRRVLTTSVTLALIALSFLLLWWASYEQKVTNDKGGEQSCNGTVFTAANVTAGECNACLFAIFSVIWRL